LQLHLTYLQLLSAGIALVLVAFLACLALAAFIDERKRKQTPFLYYLRSDFDREHPQQDSFTEQDDWNSHNRVSTKDYEAGDSNPSHSDWN
jgi:hypothetical protein